jgi:glucose 1-dehydrogenase
MRAVWVDYEDRRMRCGETDAPADPGPGQALVRIVEGGICGTDRGVAQFLYGFPPAGETMLVLGHEAVGIVARAGEDTGMTAGDWVVPMVRRECRPPCAMCASGRRDNCLTMAYTERGIAGEHGYLCEYALDAVADLVRVPPSIAAVAVLVEPASVIVKAYERALAIHPAGEIRDVLILGAGAVGMLAAWSALLRGWRATVVSLEPEDDPRVRLLARHGVAYRRSLGAAQFDLVLEACGSAAMAAASLANLRPCGVQMVLGARAASVEIPYLDLILGNRIVAGSVNASRGHFEAASLELSRMDRQWLVPMIARRPLAEAVETVLAPPPGVVKTVHALGE